MVEFDSGGGGFLAVPANPNGGAVLVLQEYWGLVDHIKDVARRFASEGYVALAPDLYRGVTTTDPDKAGAEMMGLDIERAAGDLEGAVAFLLSHDAVTKAHIGAVGFCMGGQLALYAASLHQGVGPVVNFYGIHPEVKPDLAKVNGPVLCHFATDDAFVPTESAKALVNSLVEAGVEVEPHFYNTGHAFFNDARPDAYSQADAESAWSRTLAHFQKAL